MPDKHIIKMITETAQLLSSTYYYTGEDGLAPYKLTHQNHPCSVWARQSLQNWLWLRDLGLAMYREYKHRYGAHKTHKAGEIIQSLSPPQLCNSSFFVPPACIPEYCIISDNIVDNYRNYYNKEKRHLFKWTNRNVPHWIDLEGITM